MVRTIFIIHHSDNVATVLKDGLQKGERISVAVAGKETAIELKDVIPYGHKVAVTPIPKGEPVIKYGITIGIASKDIAAGEHTHVHNIESSRGRGDLAKGGHNG
jgi:altronate dehydratase small subunit